MSAQKGPIFVAGLERSGTSLMYALLSSHPSIAMTRRTNLWTYFYDQYGDLADPRNLDRCLAVMTRYKRLVKLHPDPERVRREFRAGQPTYGRLFAILEEHNAERLGKARWGDKSLNTERHADAIFEAYPDARILHMMRDPRDRYASVQTRWESRLGGTGGGVAEWLSSAHLAARNRKRHAQRYEVIRYESLASEPEATLRFVCRFIGEPYEPAMLSMDGATTFRDQGSNSSYGARPVGLISTDSIGRYRAVLSPIQIKVIEIIARREMAEYAYEPDGEPLSWRSRFELGLELPLELMRLTGWRIRNAIRNRRGRPVPDYRLLPQPEPARSTSDQGLPDA